MRLTPSWNPQNPKYHIERTGRIGYGDPNYGRVALCGAPIPAIEKEVDEDAVPEGSRCKSCDRFYASGSR